MRKPLSFLLALAIVALAALSAQAEVAFKSLSVSQTVTSWTFASKTKVVLIVASGANTCFYRLFNNRDTPANATTAHIPILSGASKRYDITRDSTNVDESTQGAATSWQAISAICSSGQTATFSIESW